MRARIASRDQDRPIAAAMAKLPVKQAYLDGELCGVRLDGTLGYASERRRR
jgi:hypothetical protein